MSDLKKLKINILDKVENKFEVKKLNINFKEEFHYSKLIHLIKFNIEQYEIKDLGNMAILKGKGLKLMKMLTVVFTPTTTKDIPLVIIDFIQVVNKRTVLIEFYTDHITEKDNIKFLEDKLKNINIKYENIENYIQKPNWYTPLRNKYSPLKKSTKKDDSILYKMVLENLVEYLNYARIINANRKDKNRHLESFINDLIYKGNPINNCIRKSCRKRRNGEVI